MVPQFRYQLLKAIDRQPENLATYKEDIIDDNLLKQLQKLFGYLELSDRHAYNPKEFCFAFKEFDGTPTRIGEQKDSQEFLNIFCERVESQLKDTSQKDLMRDVFSGN
jgi:ubiquitin carboxyl-terminal hydrolase 34